MYVMTPFEITRRFDIIKESDCKTWIETETKTLLLLMHCFPYFLFAFFAEMTVFRFRKTGGSHI